MPHESLVLEQTEDGTRDVSHVPPGLLTVPKMDSESLTELGVGNGAMRSDMAEDRGLEVSDGSLGQLILVHGPPATS